MNKGLSFQRNQGIEEILSSKLNQILSRIPQEVITDKGIGRIIKEFDLMYEGSSLAIGDYFRELNISNSKDLVNFRHNGFNLVIVLYLLGGNLKDDLLTLDGVESLRDDMFLGELLSGISIDLTYQSEIYFYLLDYIKEIYKTGEANFNATSKLTNKTFLEFLISTYSHYLYMGEENAGGNTVCSIILEFLKYLLGKNSISFTKKDVLNFIENESKCSYLDSFLIGMNKIRNIFEDYEEDLKSQKSLNEGIITQIGFTNKAAIDVYKNVSRI